MVPLSAGLPELTSVTSALVTDAVETNVIGALCVASVEDPERTLTSTFASPGTNVPCPAESFDATRETVTDDVPDGSTPGSPPKKTAGVQAACVVFFA